MNVKMTLSFPGETIETLREKAKAEGFLSPNLLARYLIMRGLKNNANAEIGETDGKSVYQLEVEQPQEIEAYVKAKRLGSVPDFAKYAMELAMSRAPLTAAQQRRVDTSGGK
jgi:hypothetical protein